MTRTKSSKTGRTIARIAGILVAGLIGAAALLPVQSASAQTLWIERHEIVDKLGGQYAEAPVAMGLASNGGVIELFTSADGATWTLVLTMPDGLSRIVAAGEGWTTVPIRIAGHDS